MRSAASINEPEAASFGLPTYRQGGVVISQNGPYFLISYSLNDKFFEEKLPMAGPAEGTGERTDERIGVHAWFDRKQSCWIVVHTYLTEIEEKSEWRTDTVFLFSDGRIVVRNGYDAKGRITLTTQFNVIAFLILAVAAVTACYKLIQYGLTRTF